MTAVLEQQWLADRFGLEVAMSTLPWPPRQLDAFAQVGLGVGCRVVVRESEVDALCRALREHPTLAPAAKVWWLLRVVPAPDWTFNGAHVAEARLGAHVRRAFGPVVGTLEEALDLLASIPGRVVAALRSRR